MPYGPKRLTEKQVSKLREFYHSGKYTQKQLAVKFKISQSMVCKIVNNISHKHCEGIRFSGEAEVRLGFNYGN